MGPRHSLIRLSLAILCCASAHGQQYIVSTVAGNGTQGYSGDQGSAMGSQLAFPGRVAVNSSGNLYIADAVNHRVRMVANGTITTVAGNGTAGYTGDNSAATSAELNSPTGIALDSSGNLYIADAGNHVIRKVTSGTITTVAGNNKAGAGYTGDTGAATSAQLNDPVAVAVDSSGNIFIADAGNSVIREVSGTTITTVVGGAVTPYQFLNHPDGVAVDKAGAIYIADTVNRRIVKFSGGVLTTVAGNGNAGFSGDNGPATKAALNDPTGVALDAAGNLYIADTFNNRIRKVTSGIITTIAGNNVAGYYGDGGSATNAGLFFPHDVAVDANGNVYVADTNNSSVRLLQIQTPVISAGGVVNAASFAPQVSPGALASVFGVNFTGTKAGASVPLGTILGGVTVNVNGRAAPILYVTPNQVNFQVPWQTGVGSATITIQNGLSSNTVNVAVLTAAPGLFVLNSGQAVVQNADHTLNSPGNPAKAGSTVTAYLTGSGPVDPPVADGMAPPDNTLVQVTSSHSAAIGSAPANVSFAGLAPTFVGLLQMNIEIPSGLAAGDYPLTVSINGESSNSGTISIAP